MCFDFETESKSGSSFKCVKLFQRFAYIERNGCCMKEQGKEECNFKESKEQMIRPEHRDFRCNFITKRKDLHKLNSFKNVFESCRIPDSI